MTPERIAELRARYPSVTAVAELADGIESLTRQRNDWRDAAYQATRERDEARVRVGDLEAEHEKFRPEWGIRTTRSEATFFSAEDALREATGLIGHEASNDDIAWRLVGPWRDADITASQDRDTRANPIRPSDESESST